MRPARAYATTNGGEAKIIRANVRMDAPFEISIAAEDGDSDEIILLDSSANCFGKRSAVSDTSGAAEANEIESQLVQKWSSGPRLQDNRSQLLTRAQGSFSPKVWCETALDGFFREKSCANHQRGIRSIRATRDRGDDD